jgi:hypothetical protein
MSICGPSWSLFFGTRPGDISGYCKILFSAGTMDELLLHISQRLEALQVRSCPNNSSHPAQITLFPLQVLLSSSASSSRQYLQEYSRQLAVSTSRLREIAASCLCQLNVSAVSFKDNVSAVFNRSWDNAYPYVTDLQERLWLILQWLKELLAQIWQIISQRSLQPHGGI